MAVIEIGALSALAILYPITNLKINQMETLFFTSNNHTMLNRITTLFVFLLITIAGNAQIVRTMVVSGDWDVATNWAPIGVPGPGDDVVLSLIHI